MNINNRRIAMAAPMRGSKNAAMGTRREGREGEV